MKWKLLSITRAHVGSEFTYSSVDFFEKLLLIFFTIAAIFYARAH